MLIAGGKGQGQGVEPLADAARARVAHALLIGEDAPKIGAALAAGDDSVTQCRSLQEAVDRAPRASPHPATSCCSRRPAPRFDMFDNFEHRGDVFKNSWSVSTSDENAR